MTPEERAEQVCQAHTPIYTHWGDLPQIVAAAIRDAESRIAAVWREEELPKAVAAERDACAKAAESRATRWGNERDDAYCLGALDAAAAIRARGNA